MATEDRASQGDGLLISDLARRDRSGLLRLILEQQRELIALRAVAAAADELAALVRHWGDIPSVPGREDEYEARISAAEDAIIGARERYDALRSPLAALAALAALDALTDDK